MQELPPEVTERLSQWLEAKAKGSLREVAGELSVAYAKGETSAAVDLAAYLTTRMPATYAAISSVFGQIAEHFAPTSLLDVGAGPGTAALAAAQTWPSLAQFTLVESDPRFVDVARDIALASLASAKIVQGRLQDVSTTADMVVAAYVFAELPEAEAASAALKLWAVSTQALLIIEPGTPRGFARIRAARAALLAAGARIVGPCTHAAPCPMPSNDWCHFKTRLQRTRLHLHAKGANVPFEDEAFSWVAFAREAVPLPTARIIASPRVDKTGVKLRLCTEGGISDSVIAARDKARYKQGKKLRWGEALR